MKKLIYLCLILFVMTQPLGATLVNGRVVPLGRTVNAEVVTVVYAEPLDGNATIQPGTYSVSQRDKVFSPHVLAIPVGSSVEFPNDDLIFHNVFSLSRPGPFDLGLYRVGTSRSVMFMSAAVYRVFCNIHPQMSAIVLALPTPYFAQADASGAYQLDLPAGRYRITAWSERSSPLSMEVTVADTEVSAAELMLDESQFVQVQHQNKFGQEYFSMAYEPMLDTHVR